MPRSAWDGKLSNAAATVEVHRNRIESNPRVAAVKLKVQSMQIFICYARVDQQFALHLVGDLVEYDLRIWMDVRSIPHGANWDMEVQKGLDSSDLMLVLLTPASAASQNVADEWSYFVEKNKAIMPLLVEPCEVPFRLSRRQRVDFTQGYERGFQQLLKAIGSPPLLDPDQTQKVRVGPSKSASKPAAQPVPATVAVSPPKPASKSPAAIPSPIAPEVGVKMLPVIWAQSYHWFHGMGPNALQGDAMISDRELKLVPHARPIVAIPLSRLASARIHRSVDHYLKITYYGPDGAFQSLALMGAPKDRRKQITYEVLNLLKLLTGRSLE
jgi:TIR domain